MTPEDESNDATPNTLAQTMPLAATLGITTMRADKEFVVGRLAWAAELCTAGGTLHGGALMALADSTGAMSAFLHLPEGATGTTTIESKTNFLRGVRQGTVESVSRPVHVGRTLIVVETELRDDHDALVALVRQTQLVLT
ncbi:MAG TPA: PaaI family thioesterase [Acidimicrobiales bacterium]|jgi:uncharacterized protein (TIGR00369 family)